MSEPSPDPTLDDVEVPEPSNRDAGDSGDSEGDIVELLRHSAECDDREDSEESEDSERDSAEQEMLFRGKDIPLDQWTDTDTASLSSEDTPAKRSKSEEEEPEPSGRRASPAGAAGGLSDSQEPQCPSGSPTYWRSHEETDPGPFPLPFRPLCPPGPQHEVLEMTRPLDYFKLFFSNAVIKILVENTNAYGARHAQETNEPWTEVTAPDLFSFISLALFMDFFRFPQIDDYWSENTLRNFAFPRTVMSQMMFLSICRALHLSSLEMDAENRGRKRTPRYDPLGKIKPFYLELVEACKTNFQPDQNLCINERIVAQEQKGRLFAEGGYRVFTLTDSASGYMWNLIVCEIMDSSRTDRALSYSSVVELADTERLGSGYHLYLEKAQTSPRVVQDLWAKGVGACGIVSKTRKGFPKTLENDLTPGDVRGTLRWARVGAILFLKWKDAGEMAMCSTLHVAYSGDTVRKRQRVGGKYVTMPVPYPPAVKDHGEHMRDVDCSEVLTEHKNILLRNKWYQALFFHFLNIAVKNAHILYNLHHKKQMCHRWFLEMLVEQLVDNKDEHVTP